MSKHVDAQGTNNSLFLLSWEVFILCKMSDYLNVYVIHFLICPYLVMSMSIWDFTNFHDMNIKIKLSFNVILYKLQQPRYESFQYSTVVVSFENIYKKMTVTFTERYRVQTYYIEPIRPTLYQLCQDKISSTMCYQLQ